MSIMKVMYHLMLLHSITMFYLSFNYTQETHHSHFVLSDKKEEEEEGDVFILHAIACLLIFFDITPRAVNNLGDF